jgi:hypothetical protein
MSTEKEDMLLRFLHNQGYTWSQAIQKVDEVKLKEEFC